jgi:DNA-binding GntR family transcriptional regulator/DNA-binding CsgD family transcriptional regulator
MHGVRTGLLASFGVPQSDEDVYLFLLSQPRASGPEIMAGTGLPRTQVRVAVQTLTSNGLITSGPGRTPRFAAVPPEAALHALAYRRRQEIDAARLAAVEALSQLYEPGSASLADLIEVVSGERAVRERTVQLLANAETEVLELSRPPYLMSTDDIELANLARGVSYRYVYDHQALGEPGMREAIESCARAGEQARLAATVPLKLSIVDRRVARMFLSSADPDVRTGLVVVHSSSVLDALIELFELCWERAVPLPTAETQPADGAAFTPLERQLLAMLASGLKDETIAKHLGVTTRSLRRRMAPLLDHLGARTRFQAGMQAIRHGVLPS